MAASGGGDDKPPKRLGRGLSEVSHIFLSAAEKRRTSDLSSPHAGRSREGQPDAGGEIPGGPHDAGVADASEVPRDGSAQERATGQIGRRRMGPQTEAAVDQDRSGPDSDLWLPRATYISVTSGEGVRGKTLLAGNLAYGLQARGRKVALVGADSGGLDIFDATAGRRGDSAGVPSSAGVSVGGIPVVDAVRLGGIHGAGARAGTGNEPRGPLGERDLLDSLEQAGREAQIVIVDTCPWADLSREVWKIAALSIVMAEPDSDRMRAAYVAIKRVRTASPTSRIGLVLNCVRSYAQGEECFRKLAEVSRKFLKTNLRNYGYIPHDTVVGKAYQTAIPLVRAFPDSKAAKCIEAILGLIVMDESAIARRRREVTYEECALKRGRLQALRS